MVLNRRSRLKYIKTAIILNISQGKLAAEEQSLGCCGSNQHEKMNIHKHFRENGLPSAIRSIDGTPIHIDKPSIGHESYLNRNNFIQQVIILYVQVILVAQLVFLLDAGTV